MEEFKDLASTLVVSIVGGSVALFGNYLVSRYQESNKFRLAALDKKLEAHQKAFTLWHKLLFSLSDNDKCNNAIEECQDWWFANCLYLPPEVRRKFYFQLMATVSTSLLPNEKREEQFNKVAEIGKLIEQSLDNHVAGTDIQVSVLKK